MVKLILIEIEGASDDKEHEMKINIDTKELKNKKTKKLDRDERGGYKRKTEKINTEDMVSSSTILKTAEKSLSDGKIEDWEIKQEVGVTYWEVVVEKGLAKDIEVKINAQTGDVLSIDD